MTPNQFITGLQSLKFENTFNPYLERCDVYDLVDAPQLRSINLLGILEAAVNVEVDSLWIGRDLGHRGGRRTGLALTDDNHMDAHAKRWGIEIIRPTKGNAINEITAKVIWDVLTKIETPIFLWNVFPLHPHQASDSFSNRSHNKREREVGEEFLTALVQLVRPKRIIAIGNDAALSAKKIAANITIQVRHPSYGGIRDFQSGIQSVYSI